MSTPGGGTPHKMGSQSTSASATASPVPNIPPRLPNVTSPSLAPADRLPRPLSGHNGNSSSSSASGSRSSSRPASEHFAESDLPQATDEDGTPISDHQKARIIERHLARPEAIEDLMDGVDKGVGPSSAVDNGSTSAAASGIQSPFSDEEGEGYLGPHNMQGGAITDDVYRWAHNNKRRPSRRTRSESLHIPRTNTIDPELDANAIKEPGGFRRYFVLNQAQEQGRAPPRALRSFIDFLSLYGHFAGEDLDEEDEDEDKDDLERDAAAADGGRQSHERSALLGDDSARRRPSRLGHRRGRTVSGEEPERGEASVLDAVLMLLKSFVGTGILFLGKAFMNGGLLFSIIVLCAVAIISLLSFLLLVETNLKVPASFGDMGGKLYGPKMRLAILASIVFSQIGFVAAYTVFVAQNLQAFILAVTNCRMLVSTAWLILAQCLIFMPLSLIRKIAKLSSTALVADAFILLGIVYLFQYEIAHVAKEGIADVVMFNSKTFPLFIGTAVFTFEGIGLVIPITESMKEPERFPKALSGVMCGVMFLFATSGALSYSAFGSQVQTVVISNLPQTSKFVQAVQFLYSLAILLSTPLQLFPAVSILERGVFSSKSGKHDAKVKLQKNLFRCSIVIACSIFAWLGSASLDVFVSFIGSVACVPLCFIYPPLLHLKGVAKTNRQRLFNYAILAVGVAFTVFAGGQTIKTLISGGGPPDAPPECVPRR